MRQLWSGVLLVGYDERSVEATDSRPAKTYYSAKIFDLESGEPVAVDMDGPPNGTALPSGTPVDLEVTAVFRRAVGQTRDGRRSFVSDRVEPRFTLVSMTRTTPAAVVAGKTATAA
jgi:hypothetical protein